MWQKLWEKKIYFGHQSVGFNIMTGMEDVFRENHGLKLKVMETNDPADFSEPGEALHSVSRQISISTSSALIC